MCLWQWPCKIKTYQNSHNLSFPICKLGETSRIFRIYIIAALNKYCSKYSFLYCFQKFNSIEVLTLIIAICDQTVHKIPQFVSSSMQINGGHLGFYTDSMVILQNYCQKWIPYSKIPQNWGITHEYGFTKSCFTLKLGGHLHNVLILLIKNSARSCRSGNQAKFTYLPI